MTPEQDWRRLLCDSCGCERFFPSVHLRWKQHSGMVSEPGPYYCAECHALVDTARLIRAAQVQSAKQRVTELEAEIAEDAPGKAAVLKAPVAEAKGAAPR